MRATRNSRCRLLRTRRSRTTCPPQSIRPRPRSALAAALSAPPEGVVSPIGFLAKLAGLDIGDALRERADAIHKAGRGTLFTYADAKSTPVKEVKPDDFWKALNEGGCWLDDEVAVWKEQPVEWAAGTSAGATRAPSGPRRASGLASPLLSKLYQESDLWPAPEKTKVTQS